MANLNQVTLIGNLTRDIEFRDTPNSKVATLGLALNHTYTNAAGEKVAKPTYVDVQFWGKQAEWLGKFQLAKGSPLLVTGRLDMDSWADKTTGQKRTKHFIHGENFQLLGARPVNGAQNNAPRQGAAQQDKTYQESSQPVSAGFEDHDDVPF